MKKLVIAVLMAIIAGMPFTAKASGLEPAYCSLTESNRMRFSPITDIWLQFKTHIIADDNAVGTIYCGDEIMLQGKFVADNYYATEANAIFTLDEPLLLPKGKSYRFVMPAGVIKKKDAPTESIDELVYTFEIPEYLPMGYAYIDLKKITDGNTIIDKAESIGFRFSTEIETIEGSEMTLLREGVPVRNYPCISSWDWDLGLAWVELAEIGEKMTFEKGVRYTLRMPEGVVSSLYRSDIVNAAAEVSFIGGYTEPVEYLHYVWCSLYDNHPSDVLNEVRFYYDRAIVLAENPTVQLCEESSGNVVKTVVPTLSTSEGRWVVTADFEGTPLEAGKGYSIVIPEGTIISEDGDVVVNTRNVMEIDRNGSVSAIETDAPIVKTQRGLITIENAAHGAAVNAFTTAGKLIYSTVANTDPIAIPIATAGIYVVSIDGIAHKVAVK